jgi:hypothetical protein
MDAHTTAAVFRVCPRQAPNGYAIVFVKDLGGYPFFVTASFQQTADLSRHAVAGYLVVPQELTRRPHTPF